MAVHPLKKAQESDDDEIALSPMDRRITPRRVTPQRLTIGGLILVVLSGLVYIYMEYGLGRSLTVDAERLTLRIAEGAQEAFEGHLSALDGESPMQTRVLDARSVYRVHVDYESFPDNRSSHPARTEGSPAGS